MDTRIRNIIAAAAFAITLAAAFPAHATPTEADNQFTFAVRLYERGEKLLAEDAFEDFLHLYPNDSRRGDVHYYLALAARDRKDITKALELLDQAKDARDISAVVRQILRAQLLLQSKRPAEALAQLEPIDPNTLANDSSRATLHHLTGGTYWQLKNFAAAAKQFETAAALDTPHRATALLDLGRTYVMLKRPAEAIKSLRESAEANPQKAGPALLIAANIAYEHKQFDLAQQLYKQIAEHHQSDPAFGPSLLGQLAVLSASGRDADVIQQYPNAAKLLPPPYRAEAMYLFALAQFRTRAFDQSIQTCKTFDAHFANHQRADDMTWMLAAAYFNITNYTAFDGVARRYLKTFPNSSRLWDMRQLLAQSAINRERYDDAIALLTPLIETDGSPYVASSFAWRGSMYDKSNRLAEALAEYEKVLAAHPDYRQTTAVMLRAVDIAFSLQQYPKAIAYTDAAAKREDVTPDGLATARFKKAVALIRLKQNTDALSTLQALLDAKLPPDLQALADYYRGLLLASRAHHENQPPGAKPLVGEPRQAMFNQAIASLTRALKGPLGNAERAQTWQILAKVYRLTNQIPKALDAYQKLHTEQPKFQFDLGTRIWIGTRLQEHDQPQAALQWLEPLLQAEGLAGAGRAEALYRTAKCYQSLKQYDEAVKRFTMLATFSKLYGERGSLGMAQTLVAMGRPHTAMAEYDRLLSATGSDVAATALYEGAILRRQLADEFEASGETKRAHKLRVEARKWLQRVVILHQSPQLTPTPQLAALMLGEMYQANDDPAQARITYQELINRNEQNPWGDVARAELFLLNGQRADGVYQLQQIFKNKATDAADHARTRLVQLGEPIPVEAVPGEPIAGEPIE
ncbi:MAG: hypothetical protein CMJ49_09760 [Planctomycetaceae bacterium]|nr:hypothetical protein [Planctomycetaceae bacterium]